MTCQHAKVHQHNRAPLSHWDLVSQLHPHQVARGGSFFTTTFADVVCVFLLAWVKHFGSSSDITSDRGPQFIKMIWSVLARSPSTQAHVTTVYHPKCNSLREPSQVTQGLRAALLDGNLVDHLPLMMLMLGLCSAPKEEIDASPADLVFRQPLRVLGKFARVFCPFFFPVAHHFFVRSHSNSSPSLFTMEKAELGMAGFVFSFFHDKHSLLLNTPIQWCWRWARRVLCCWRGTDFFPWLSGGDPGTSHQGRLWVGDCVLMVILHF